MRALGLVGLLLALAIVGLLAKKQLSAVSAIPATGQGVQVSPGATRTQQSQQLEQQIKQSVESSLQPRAMPEESK